MADHVLPLQFLNLGGEMLYIIDQRLRAQEVPLDRATKGCGGGGVGRGLLQLQYEVEIVRHTKRHDTPLSPPPVRNDILGMMLNPRFLEEVFTPQPPYSRVALRGVFERLAHGSIMRLNAASMDKVSQPNLT